MGDGTQENPFTREDVLRLIKENGGKTKGLNLSKKVFKQGIDLSGLDLKEVNLSDALFPMSCEPEIIEGVNLTDAHLEKADLKRIHLERADLTDTHLEGANLWHAHLERAYLWDTHLEGANLIGTHFEGVNLTRTKFSRDVSLEDVDWGNYILGEEREGEEREGNDRVMWFNFATTTYRRLKIWYAEHGMYDLAGEFFFREMEAKRKAQSWKKKPHLKLWSWVMRMLCGYGEKPERVAISAIVIIFGLAIVYRFGGLSLPYSIYFSAVSFTALGYGSWAQTPPSNWVQGLGAFESFLGVFMMALFLVTFIRKMTR